MKWVFSVCVFALTASIICVSASHNEGGRRDFQKVLQRAHQLNLHTPTLIELQQQIRDLPTNFTSFDSLLTRFRNNLLDQQNIGISIAANESVICDIKIKALANIIKGLNDTLVATTKTINDNNKQIDALKVKVQEIVVSLDPKVKELEGIVKSIQEGASRRGEQKESNEKKINETTQMRLIIAQLSKDLSSQPQFKFRESVAALEERVEDVGLQRFLQTTLSMMASPNDTQNSNITSANVAKLKQLLSLLDVEMHDYINQIVSAEKSASDSWIKVLATFQSQRSLVQKQVSSALDKKKAAMDEITKRQQTVLTLTDKIDGFPEKLAVLAPQYATWTQECGEKKVYFEQQAQNRREQLATLDAVGKLTTSLKGTNVQQVLDRVVKQTTTPPVPTKPPTNTTSTK